MKLSHAIIYMIFWNQTFMVVAQSRDFEPFELIIWSAKSTELEKIKDIKTAGIKSKIITAKKYGYPESSYSARFTQGETRKEFYDRNGIKYTLNNGDTLYSIITDKHMRPVETKFIDHYLQTGDPEMKISGTYYYSDTSGRLPDKIKIVKIYCGQNDTELIHYRYSYFRDTFNRLLRIESYYNHNTKPLIHDIAYDSLGRVVKYHEHIENGYTPWYNLTYHYNPSGNIVKIVNSNSNRGEWVDYLAVYDTNGLLISEDLSPEGKSVGTVYKIRYAYNSKNLIYKAYVEFIYIEKFRTLYEYAYTYY